MTKHVSFGMCLLKQYAYSIKKNNMLEGNGIIKQLKNPAYGLLPMLVFTILAGFVSTWIAVGVGLVLAALGVYKVKLYSRMLYDISLISFVFALIMSMLYPTLSGFDKFILTEVIFVTALIASRLTRAKVIARLARYDRSEVRNYLSESFRVAFQTQYSLFFHLLLILVFFVLSEGSVYAINHIPIIIIAAAIYVVIMVLEVLRLRMLDKKLNEEDWLPVVNESGQVTGRVAKSITIASKNKYLHPVVRIALINKGRLFLVNRDADKVLNPGMLDYPFEKYLKYRNDIEQTISNLLSSIIGDKKIPLQFMLKYVFENDITKRLILLYVSVVDDDEFNSLGLDNGKLWTIKQIEENQGMNVFSEPFELEFEYLKNTVLLSYNMTNGG